MSRVIKFRAWDKKYSVMLCTGFNIVGEVTLFNGVETMLHEQSVKHNDETASLLRLNDVEIMQFTGLHDRNGVAIYEGDIIPCKVGVQQYSNWVVGDEDATLNGVVEWNEHQLCWQIGFKQPNKYGIISSHFGWGSSPIIAVIGNTHQNHTLL
jgi:uncharacterized phage protein (TIGR01671 family)